MNSLGDSESRSNYRNALVDYLSNFKADLSEDSQRRLTANPLRILDPKDEGDRKILENAPSLSDYLNDLSKEHFDKVISALDASGIQYIRDPKPSWGWIIIVTQPLVITSDPRPRHCSWWRQI